MTKSPRREERNTVKWLVTPVFGLHSFSLRQNQRSPNSSQHWSRGSTPAFWRRCRLQWSTRLHPLIMWCHLGKPSKGKACRPMWIQATRGSGDTERGCACNRSSTGFCYFFQLRTSACWHKHQRSITLWFKHWTPCKVADSTFTDKSLWRSNSLSGQQGTRTKGQN